MSAIVENAGNKPVFPALSRNSAVPARIPSPNDGGGLMDSTLTRSGSTVLNLLTKDGAISVVFPAFLTEEQYAKLFESIREYSDSRLELKVHIAMLANEWGLDASFEDGAV